MASLSGSGSWGPVVVAVPLLALACGLVVAGPGGRVAASTGPASTGPAAVGNDRAVTSPEVGRNPAAVRDFWTPRRMRTARPADLTLPGDPAVRPAGGAAPPVPVTRSTAGSAPSVTVPGTVGASSASLPDPRATAVTSPYTRLPYRTNGKVFFTNRGSRWVCSGTAVNSANKSVVWTAGHCVHDGDFHRNWVFVPAYSARSAPYGSWAAGRLFTTPGWAARQNLSVDLGAAVVRPLDGRRLVDRVGGQGIGFNRRADRRYTSFGYPAAPPFTGLRQWRCISPLARRDHRQGRPATMAIRCDMTGGSSGGGWLRGLGDGRGRLLSVNSYGYDYTHMYGPYQGNVALGLWRQVAGYRL